MVEPRPRQCVLGAVAAQSRQLGGKHLRQLLRLPSLGVQMQQPLVGHRFLQDVHNDTGEDVQHSEGGKEDVHQPHDAPPPPHGGEGRGEGAPIRARDRPEQRRKRAGHRAVVGLQVLQQVRAPHDPRAREERRRAVGALGQAVHDVIHEEDHALHHHDARHVDQHEQQARGPTQADEHRADAGHHLLEARGVADGADRLHRPGGPRHAQEPDEGQPRARGDEFEQGDQQHHDVVKVPPAMTADEELRPAGEKLDEHLDGHPSYEGPPNLHTHVEDVVKPFLALSATGDAERVACLPAHLERDHATIEEREEEPEGVEQPTVRQLVPPRIL
mmetsp:Transcript_97848/g.273962  ORF Transcript_97848/g.273962 Transcript_97848/m.273962 type:complete len:330 (-) Transcript_97848:614-1603(-)